MNIVFLGPPGCGKGTQAKKVSEKFDLVHLSTGEMFRETVASGSALADRLKAFMEAGKLVPDDVVSEVVFEKLKNLNGKGFLLDGYPRTVDQIKALNHFSENEKVPVDVIVYFEIDNDQLVKRLTARRQCSKCKTVFNLETKPPQKENQCDACGGALSQRDDDKPEVVAKRLEVYQMQTTPILQLVEEEKGFHKIDANQSIDTVFASIISIVQATA